MGAHELREEVERRLAARRDAEQAHGPISSFPFVAGRYTVLSVISEGASGSVYRAHQQHPDREVALKLVWRDVGSLDDQRLLAAELRALSLLRHPGIVHLYDAGTVTIRGREYPFLAMELVEGVALANWVERDQPDLETRLRLVIAICAALNAAHQRGVIHRDLKPDNILVRAVDGLPQPCVLDFGIARITADPAQAAAESGRLFGSLDYMSPEQAAGLQVIDVRTDVYALGAIAYWICCGLAPVPTDALPLNEALEWIATEQPLPLRARAPHVGRDLEAVIGKALAKAPEGRYATVLEFAGDLQAVVTHRPISIRGHSFGYLLGCFAQRQRALCAALATAALALLFAVGLGWWGYARSAVELDRLLAVSQAAIGKMLRPLGTMAGTSQARRALLVELLPQVEACSRIRPADVQALQCHYEILRLIGDIDADDGRWVSALAFRTQARDLQQRLVECMPTDALAQAEVATAMVRVGDAILRVHGELAARACYTEAHAAYLALEAQHPDAGRHVDDFAWSCDRMAQMALRLGQLDLAEEFLRERALRNERLRLLRPGHPATYSGERSLHQLRSQLANRRGLADEELREVLLAVEPSRAHHRLEPNSPVVIGDLSSILITYVNLSGSALPLESAYELLDEADRLVAHLLALEPNNELARLMRAWSACVRNLHLSYQEPDALVANVLRAKARLSYAESLLGADLGAIYEDAICSARAEVQPLEGSVQQPAELPQLQSRLAALEQMTLAGR